MVALVILFAAYTGFEKIVSGLLSSWDSGD